MPAKIGYVLLGIAALIAGVNLYFGPARWLVGKCLGRPIRHISGITFFSTLFLIMALLLVPFNRWLVLAAVLICLFDTLGVPYLLGVLAWQSLRSGPRGSE